MRASAQTNLVDTHQHQLEATMKLTKKKRHKEKMKRFAETVGVEDNCMYPRFKES